MMDDHRSYRTVIQQLHVTNFCNIMANNDTLASITATTNTSSTSTTTTYDNDDDNHSSDTDGMRALPVNTTRQR